MLWHGKNFRGIINKAKEMIFNNTGTNLISTNAEDAIKEVNGKLTNLGYHLVDSSNDHLTYAQQLTNLQSAWSGLTESQKMSAILKIDTQIARCNYTTPGEFFTAFVTNNQWGFRTFIINSAKFYGAVNGTVSDMSSQSNNASMELWVQG